MSQSDKCSHFVTANATSTAAAAAATGARGQPEVEVKLLNVCKPLHILLQTDRDGRQGKEKENI